MTVSCTRSYENVGVYIKVLSFKRNNCLEKSLLRLISFLFGEAKRIKRNVTRFCFSYHFTNKNVRRVKELINNKSHKE